ncbi:tetratricopeptide repeat protein [Marinilabilia salmonicolor]|uniref:WD40 repeat protein n=1 Tax=Marinilabilia salmonicolor TaxID=989 RepID=A0A2T0XFU8_9BACT|nr:tetratricopeptide repeat protein [Marinilabilia salmonicolor]PRY97828.1 WD40 repeat protein [Marinilabilia salmonicolor]RCW29693.1 WD40 repeat protein [Marinilabilia salmonicolor]
MKQYFTIIILSILSLQMMAQESVVSPDRALELFTQGNYAEALPMYEQLIERYEREAKYNYYLGVCLVEQRQNLSEAIKRLKFAQSRRVNRDVHFYLGKAYQKAYEFELAEQEFNNFLKYATNNDPRRAKALRSVEDCKSANTLINKHFSIQIIDKDTVPESACLSQYNLPEEAGTIAKNKTFFKTGVPPEKIMYRTEKGDDVYFVLEEPDTTLHDIYFMEQLLDRWSGSKNLGEPVNSDFDDRHPFLMVDGTTFFFASDRPGGMGGLDIYRSIFDPESDTFSSPENLGPPFNSPDDDFLFAADPFGERAWFTTNRGVAPGTAVVVKIVWDNNVFKNLTEDVNQVRELALLPLSEGNFWEDGTKQEQEKQSTAKRNSEQQFQFYINDTLVYTNFDQFLSDVARMEFKRGQNVDMQKDSLEQVMRNKREQYAQSYNQEELSRLMDEILELEKKVYGHDDQVKRHYIRARQLEMDKISELKSRGMYNEAQKPAPGASSNNSLTAPALKSGNFSFYSDEEFMTRQERLNPMYKKYFSPAQIQVLQQTDSMYTWAKIMQLEASKLLESSVTSGTEEEQQKSLIQRVRNLDSLSKNNQEESGEPASRKSRYMQQQALSMYHEALDKKFNIYKPVLKRMAENQGNGHWENLLGEAQSRFEQANNGIEKMAVWNPGQYENLGGLKRQAIEMIEQSLLDSQGNNLTVSATSSTANNATSKQKTESVPADNQPSITQSERQNANNVVKAAFGEPDKKTASRKPVYKIQIGVFRNSPDSEALSRIPQVTSQAVPGKDLTRYYSGAWSGYAEAAQNIERVRNNGFPGAFIVAFIDGEKISIEKARELSSE